jgi:hypothetical protein
MSPDFFVTYLPDRSRFGPPVRNDRFGDHPLGLRLHNWLGSFTVLRFACRWWVAPQNRQVSAVVLREAALDFVLSFFGNITDQIRNRCKPAIRFDRDDIRE